MSLATSINQQCVRVQVGVGDNTAAECSGVAESGVRGAVDCESVSTHYSKCVFSGKTRRRGEGVSTEVKFRACVAFN